MEKEHPQRPTGEDRYRQASFLAPEDADFLRRLRGMVAEAERFYETRTLRPTPEAPIFKSPAAVYSYLRPLMGEEPREHLRVLTLTTRHQLIRAPLVYKGSVNGIAVRPAEIFRPAILDNARSIMIAHNHPSGIVTPSAEDISITRRLVEVGRLMDIELVDHLIVARDSFASLREMGQGFDR